MFRKISYNSWSGRKKFNLLNRSIIWLYIDDKAVLSPPCIRSLEGRNSVSLESGISCAALPHAALPNAGPAPPWRVMSASTHVQQALSQDRKDPRGTLKAESSIHEMKGRDVTCGEESRVRADSLSKARLRINVRAIGCLF